MLEGREGGIAYLFCLCIFLVVTLTCLTGDRDWTGQRYRPLGVERWVVSCSGRVREAIFACLFSTHMKN